MKKNGFTLIELMIVVGILAAITIPAYIDYKCRQNPVQCKIDNPELYERTVKKGLIENGNDSIVISPNHSIPVDDEKFVEMQEKLATLEEQMSALIDKGSTAQIKIIEGKEYACIGANCYRVTNK